MNRPVDVFRLDLRRVNAFRFLLSLGFSRQRPVGRALERDEAQIEHWNASGK